MFKVNKVQLLVIWILFSVVIQLTSATPNRYAAYDKEVHDEDYEEIRDVKMPGDFAKSVPNKCEDGYILVGGECRLEQTYGSTAQPEGKHRK